MEDFTNEPAFVPYDIYLSAVEERDAWEERVNMLDQLHRITMEISNKLIEEYETALLLIRDAYPHITHKPTCDKPLGLDCDCNLDEMLTRFETLLIEMEKREQIVKDAFND